MTTYTFTPSASSTSVSWTDPTIWDTGTVPSDSSADVVIPQTIVRATGQPYVSTITLTGSETIDSLSITDNTLTVNGSLSLAGALTINAAATVNVNGALSASSITNAAYLTLEGSVTSSGDVVNSSVIQSLGSTDAITSLGFTNNGMLQALAADLTVTTGAAGFSNLSSGTLTGGTYLSMINPGLINQSTVSLSFNVGGVATVDAATIVLQGGDIAFYDNATSAYVSITASMHDIAATGSLEVDTAYSWSDLTVDGVLTMGPFYNGMYGSLTTTLLTVDPGGLAEGNGTISGPIVDNGVILADAPAQAFNQRNVLTLAGPATGSGVLEIGKAFVTISAGEYFYTPSVMALDAATTLDVDFLDTQGALILNDPTEYTGRITPMIGQDQIQFPTVSVSSYSYAGDASGGVLTLQTSGGVVSLKIAGDFNTDSFGLTRSGGVSIITVANTARPVANLLNQGLSDVLVRDAAGAVLVGQVGAGGQLAFSTVGALGSDWSFEGVGDFLPGSQSQYLIESASGAVVAGNVQAGQASYTQLGALGPEWTIEAVGDFTGFGQDQYLMKNDSGAYVVGTYQGGGQTSYLQVAGLGSDWSVAGEGDFLGTGHDQILLRNTNGAVVAADVEYVAMKYQTPGYVTTYSQIGALGADWHIEETGEFLGHGKSDFLMENDNGALVVGEVGNGVNPDAAYTVVGGLGAEWHFIGAGDYTRNGPDGFLIENSTTGAIDLGQVVAGHAQYAQIGTASAGWVFHS